MSVIIIKCQLKLQYFLLTFEKTTEILTSVGLSTFRHSVCLSRKCVLSLRIYLSESMSSYAIDL